MKKVLLISLITVFLWSFKEPEDLKWYSLTEGLELAHSENKPILLFIYVTWCDKCQRMEKKVFNNKEVLPLITENFIPVKLNAEIDTAYFHNDKTLDRKYFLKEVSSGKFQIGVPTTVFYRVKDNDRVIMDGLQDPEELTANIKKFLKK